MRPYKETEVLNAGVPGYSPYQELCTLQRLAPRIEPYLLIQIIFIGDDWLGNERRQSPEEARATIVEQLRIHSVLVRFIDRWVLSTLKNRDQYEIHRRVPTPEFTARMGNVLSLLEETRAVARHYDAGFLVVLCPRYTQVYEEAWSKGRAVYGLSEEGYTPVEPNRLFRERLRTHDFWTVDLLAPLRGEVHRRRLNFRMDGHWNRDGNKFVAAVLAKSVGGWLDRGGRG